MSCKVGSDGVVVRNWLVWTRRIPLADVEGFFVGPMDSSRRVDATLRGGVGRLKLVLLLKNGRRVRVHVLGHGDIDRVATT